MFRSVQELVLDNNPSLMEVNFSKRRHGWGELPSCIVFRMNGCPRVDTSKFRLEIFPNLECLELNGNGISDLSFFKEFKNLRRLKCLRLNGNVVETLPESGFATFPELVCLDLSSNRIKTIDPDFSFRGLEGSMQELYLEDNRLTAFGNILATLNLSPSV